MGKPLLIFRKETCLSYVSACPVNVFLYESGLRQSWSTVVLRHPYGQAVEGNYMGFCAAFPMIEGGEVSVTLRVSWMLFGNLGRTQNPLTVGDGLPECCF